MPFADPAPKPDWIWCLHIVTAAMLLLVAWLLGDLQPTWGSRAEHASNDGRFRVRTGDEFGTTPNLGPASAIAAVQGFTAHLQLRFAAASEMK